MVQGVGRIEAGLAGHDRAEGKLTYCNVLHYGGPVEPWEVLTLHTTDYAIEVTLRVTPGNALTADPDILRAIERSKGPKRYLIALG